MTIADNHNQYDVVIIGAGLGGAAAARMLARAGKSVAVVSGAGRSRSLDADGGLVDPLLIEQAFGPGAPLGGIVSAEQRFMANGVGSAPVFAPVESMPTRRSFRRLELERWALDRAIDAGSVFLDGFVEGEVRHGAAGGLVLTEESGDRSVIAGKIVLGEGSDPRIAMRAGLRPDYPPEEQIHFARVIIARPSEAVVRTGRTRTSWGMPIGVSVIPLGSVTLVTVDSRIENVMRSQKSTMDALMDVRSSRLGAALGMQGDRLHTGIELSAMRGSDKGIAMTNDGLLLGVDASGLLEMRGIDRADITIQSGIHIGGYLVSETSVAWDVAARSLLRRIKATDPGWHTSRKTGYIEESSGSGAIRSSVSKLAHGVTRRFRQR